MDYKGAQDGHLDFHWRGFGWAGSGQTETSKTFLR